MDDILRAEEVVLVDDDFSTEEQQRAAEYILEMWDEGVTLTEIAEESGFSRQHVKNTLSQYFEPVDEIHTLHSEYREAYREGFSQGYSQGHQDGVERGYRLAMKELRDRIPQRAGGEPEGEGIYNPLRDL